MVWWSRAAQRSRAAEPRGGAQTAGPAGPSLGQAQEPGRPGCPGAVPRGAGQPGRRSRRARRPDLSHGSHDALPAGRTVRGDLAGLLLLDTNVLAYALNTD